MKQTRSLVNSLIACGIALAMVSTLVAQTTSEGSATVVRIKGSARYTAGDNQWRPLKVGDVLRAGSVVQTDRDAGTYVDLVLGDGHGVVAANNNGSSSAFSPPSVGGRASYQPASQQNSVRVFENSVLGIDKMTAMETGADRVTDTQLDLKAGHILGNVKKMPAASRYEVKLPNGVAGIRGTCFDLYADGGVRVASGSVVLSTVDAQGNVQTRVVMGGQEYSPRTGQVTPISADVLQQLNGTGAALTAGAVAPVAPVATDRNVYYVSPRVSPTTGGGF